MDRAGPRDRREDVRNQRLAWISRLDPSARTVTGWLLLACAVLYFCLFDGVTSFGLVGPDEPRYAAIARDMAASGDWVTPRLNGEPWFEKPILYYWVAATGYRLLGDGELAARLPSGLGGLVTALALAWLAARTYEPATAAIVLLLYPTTIAAIAFGRAATTDMLFAAALALTMAAAYPLMVTEPGTSRWRWQTAFGAALGLAVLAKGPAGIILTGGSVALWVLATRRWTALLAVAHVWTIASFAIVALPWYVLCALRNPEFVPTFLVLHNFQRFVTPVFQHERPFWYLGGVLILGMAPWTSLVGNAAWRGIRVVKTGRWIASPALFFACWAAFPLLFFSISKSKLPGYVLPTVPALALLLSHAMAKAIEEDGDEIRWLFGGIAAALFAIAGVFFVPTPILPFVPGLEPASLRLLGAVAATTGTGVAFLIARRKPRTAFAATTLGMAVLFWQVHAVLMPQLDAAISARSAARSVVNLGGERTASAYKLHRAWHFGLDYYLRRELPEWGPERDPRSVVVTSGAGVRELESRGLEVRILEHVFDEAVIVTIAR